MKKKLLWISIPVLLIVGIALFWKPILLWIGGFHQPELETKESVIGFTRGISAKYDALAIPSNNENAKYLMQNFGTPGIIFFNGNLLPIKSSQGTGCPKVARAFVDELAKGKNYETAFESIEVKSANDILNKITWIDGNNIMLLDKIQKKDFDFIAVYSWAKFLPDQSETMMKIGEEALQKHGIKILIISLNLDFVKDWWGDKPVDVEI